MRESIDAIELNFEPSSLMALNAILGLIMFGIALSLRINDFRYVVKHPRAPLVGILAQFGLLPAATWGLTRLLELPPSISMGMILVASCPGGNISNFIAHLSRANTALSISVTALSTTAAMIFTPLNVAFWGSRSADTRAILTEFSLHPLDMLLNVLMLLGIPLASGMLLRHYAPSLASKAERPFKILSILLFVLLIIVAFRSNMSAFLAVIGIIFIPVALHNATAWVVGYAAGRAAGLPLEDTRALAIEVAIQNSGLGLVLIFSFFNGLGGMAVIAGWWGIWHVVAGLFMATLWSRSPGPRTAL
ncbi:bile acid:sodium symporter family protein [Bradymonadaceae bacterium TMQ3]|uniref:Bile acid:sodium symporter family protein n=1 Tax=Lujinxingia sediminis TaxID=2480984 RepID=A0ABY0CWM2_9DELT|nr:bile acid:sodium symporter family protein [Lujinxingia sediminis]RDV39992.1 bile acid:sodium symporter family protein [Bradymonadaceae bacterium TMQ3]RVU47961.1 bile acid:sodium symporter family protein [Lujinxingia sediminis]TXC77263.1 bile acid:sodium symporter family protein [Bradymonadales bacterium TMQ1]